MLIYKAWKCNTSFFNLILLVTEIKKKEEFNVKPHDILVIVGILWVVIVRCRWQLCPLSLKSDGWQMVAGGNWPRFNIIMRKSFVDGISIIMVLLDTREFPENVPKWFLFNVSKNFLTWPECVPVHLESPIGCTTRHGEVNLAEILGYYCYLFYYFGLSPFLQVRASVLIFYINCLHLNYHRRSSFVGPVS